MSPVIGRKAFRHRAKINQGVTQIVPGWPEVRRKRHGTLEMIAGLFEAPKAVQCRTHVVVERVVGRRLSQGWFQQAYRLGCITVFSQKCGKVALDAGMAGHGLGCVSQRLNTGVPILRAPVERGQRQPCIGQFGVEPQSIVEVRCRTLNLAKP